MLLNTHHLITLLNNTAKLFVYGIITKCMYQQF